MGRGCDGLGTEIGQFYSWYSEQDSKLQSLTSRNGAKEEEGHSSNNRKFRSFIS
jgi:hypothetical protein